MKTIFFTFLMMLFGVNAIYSQQYTVSGKVTDDENAPLAGAAVMIKNSQIGTETDFDGKYSLNVKKGDVLVFSSLGFKTVEKTADRSTTIDVVMASSETLEEVVVVGSRNQSRTAIDSPVPVDVFDARELMTSSPQTNLNQILTYAAPSFSSNTQSISDGTDHIDPASLRGLGPDQVLVLINGKRRHTTSLVNVNGTFGRGSVGTDLNAIPAAAIERIEVLRDGAAAQYGSDAIAGVINVVLKKNVDELATNVQTSGFISKNANSLTGGIDGENFSANINYGVKLTDKGGFINLTGDFENRNAFNRMGAYEGNIFNGYNSVEYVASLSGYDLSVLPNNIADIKSFAQGVTHFSSQLKTDINNATDIAALRTLLNINVTDAELATRGLERSDFNMIVGQSALRGARFFGNMSLPLSKSGSEFYAFGGMSLRKGVAGGFFRLPNQERTYTPQYLNGFLPMINSDIVDKSFAMGIKGKINEWNIDLSNTFGSNTFTYLVTNSINASQGNASKTEFNSGGPSFAQNTTNLDFSKKFDGIFNGLNVANGLEYRIEKYEITAGETSSWATYDILGTAVTNSTQIIPKDFFGRTRPGGVQVFPGFRPENALTQYRTSVAAYTDLEADLSENILLTGALRFENFSDFGNNLSYKIATMIKISENLRFRAAHNTGFRAPSLHQYYFNSTSTLFVSGIPNEVGLFSNNSKVAEIIGIPSLKPELSSSISTGFTYQIPSAKIKVTVDAYLIGIKDKVVLTGTFAPTTPELQILFTQVGATKAAFFANAIDTETRGLDAVITHQIKFGNWNLKNDLAGTLSKTIRVGEIHASPKLQGQITTYFDEAARIFLEEAVPHIKFSLANGLSSDKIDFYLRNTYFGETKEATNTIANQTVYSPKVITDLTVGYKMSKTLKLSIGANNLLDVYPDETIVANRGDGRFVFSRSSPQFGFGGRYVFAKLGFTIK
jgi:iron complex outermembrane receptor protein